MPRGEKIRKYWLGRKRGPQTAEHIEKRMQAHRGKKRSPETIAKIKRARARQIFTAEGRKHLSESMKRFWATQAGRAKMVASHYTETAQRRHLAHRLRQRMPTKMTILERTLFDEFKKRRLKFEMHRNMFGRFQPDFVFETVRLIVQADGDYWHHIREGRAERDARFNGIARTGGWTVWRFAESEIKQHPEACGRAVARFVRSH